jgi:hypothetical protein
MGVSIDWQRVINDIDPLVVVGFDDSNIKNKGL